MVANKTVSKNNVLSSCDIFKNISASQKATLIQEFEKEKIVNPILQDLYKRK